MAPSGVHNRHNHPMWTDAASMKHQHGMEHNNMNHAMGSLSNGSTNEAHPRSQFQSTSAALRSVEGTTMEVRKSVLPVGGKNRRVGLKTDVVGGGSTLGEVSSEAGGRVSVGNNDNEGVVVGEGVKKSVVGLPRPQDQPTGAQQNPSTTTIEQQQVNARSMKSSESWDAPGSGLHNGMDEEVVMYGALMGGTSNSNSKQTKMSVSANSNNANPTNGTNNDSNQTKGANGDSNPTNGTNNDNNQTNGTNDDSNQTNGTNNDSNQTNGTNDDSNQTNGTNN